MKRRYIECKDTFITLGQIAPFVEITKIFISGSATGQFPACFVIGLDVRINAHKAFQILILVPLSALYLCQVYNSLCACVRACVRVCAYVRACVVCM